MAKTKRVLALLGVILLLGCYVSTLIAALIGSKATEGLFMASLFCSIGLPIVLYGYMLVIKFLKRRADQDKAEKASSDEDITKYSTMNTSHVEKDTK